MFGSLYFISLSQTENSLIRSETCSSISVFAFSIKKLKPNFPSEKMKCEREVHFITLPANVALQLFLPICFETQETVDKILNK